MQGGDRGDSELARNGRQLVTEVQEVVDVKQVGPEGPEQVRELPSEQR